jgi:hypothetical protein
MNIRNTGAPAITVESLAREATDLRLNGSRKICLCGSTRFKEAWRYWNAKLSLDGHVVYAVAMWSHGDRVDPSPEQKLRLDAVHFRKIEESEEVFVLNVGGYIGESTQREIYYARMLGKAVAYLTWVHPGWTEEDATEVPEG